MSCTLPQDEGLQVYYTESTAVHCGSACIAGAGVCQAVMSAADRGRGCCLLPPSSKKQTSNMGLHLCVLGASSEQVLPKHKCIPAKSLAQTVMNLAMLGLGTLCNLLPTKLADALLCPLATMS